MSKIKNPFGINSNKEYVYIKTNDYENIEKYKECYCPECGDKLIPRMGKVNVWHYAHERNKECNTNFESNLHKYAKGVIKNNSKIKVPGLSVKEYFEQDKANKLLIEDMQKWDKYNNENISKELYLSSSIRNYKWIGDETRIGDFIPDCIIEIAGKRVAIEIFVTHGVDERKTKKAKTANIDMLEIYLGRIKDNVLTSEFDLEKYILEDAVRVWIHKTKIAIKDKEVYERIYNTKRYIANKKYTRPDLMKQRSLEIQSNLDIEREHKRNELIKQEKNEHLLEYNIDYEKRKRAYMVEIVEKYSEKKQSGELDICNIPVKGEYMFNCTRDVWQNKIYDKFILGQEKNIIKLCGIADWVTKCSGIQYYKESEGYIKSQFWNSKYDAIKEYIKKLVQVGVLMVLDEKLTRWTEIKVINSDKQKATGKLIENKEKEANKGIKTCIKCGKHFAENDDINAFYINNFDVDKECFEELLNV